MFFLRSGDNMQIDRFQIEAARQRYLARRAQRQRNLQLMKRGRYLQIDSPDRVQKFLLRRGFSPDQAAKMISSPEPLSVASEAYGATEPSRLSSTKDLLRPVPWAVCGLVSPRVARSATALASWCPLDC